MVGSQSYDPGIRGRVKRLITGYKKVIVEKFDWRNNVGGLLDFGGEGRVCCLLIIYLGLISV